jgi:hypothetical protein
MIANDLWIRNQFVEGYVDVRGGNAAAFENLVTNNHWSRTPL